MQQLYYLYNIYNCIHGRNWPLMPQEENVPQIQNYVPPGEVSGYLNSPYTRQYR